MKKMLLTSTLAFVCLMSLVAPANAGDGIIIVVRQSPLPTPDSSQSGRAARSGEGKVFDETPNFWDFLEYFGF